MIDPEAGDRGSENDLRARIAEVVRHDLAAEADAGFPLLRRFPNSETAGIPDYIARLGEVERDALLDALAHYCTLWWSHEIVREKRGRPVLGRYLARQPRYPPGDWYGARPKKSALKAAVKSKLKDLGYEVRKREGARDANVLEFHRPDPSFEGSLIVSFDPGLLRQMDWGYHNWLRPELAAFFQKTTPRDFTPLIHWLAYDHLWHGCGVNNAICWDLITEDNLEETLNVLGEALQRLTTLAGRINALTLS